MSHTEIAGILETLQVHLNDELNFPCRRKKDGKVCLQQYEGQFDKDDRTLFFYGIDCPVATHFCDTCLAYWLVGVARNAVFGDQRRLQMAAARR